MIGRLPKVGVYLISFLTTLLINRSGAQQAGNQTEFLIEAHKVAGIAIGDAAESVYQRYHGNARLVNLDREGPLSPALAIKPEGASREDAIIAELSCEKELIVSCIIISDSAFRTRTGLGVGSTIGQLRSHHKITSVSTGEWSCGIWVEELAMSFTLDISELHKEADSWKHPSDIPDNVKIQNVNLITRGNK
jgi:hypothetical protein